MCFAPQPRTPFRNLNFQRWLGAAVFLTFHFQICFAPQRRAIFDLSSCHMAPHPLFSDLLSSHSFASLTLPTSSASSAHIIGNLKSRFPSTIRNYEQHQPLVWLVLHRHFLLVNLRHWNLVSGNQTWFAGKTSIVDDSPSYKSQFFTGFLIIQPLFISSAHLYFDG